MPSDYFPVMNLSATISSPEVGVEVKSSAWNHSWGKRVLDISVSTLGTLVFLPLMAVVAVVVKVTSAGPVLFRQARVGEDGRIFQLLKFRTMTHLPAGAGPGVTRKGDSRITPVGRFLRGCKLDELPQLVNVMRGDMSLVGPRPELPAFRDTLALEHRELVALKPGLTGAATLEFRHEEQLLAEVPEKDLEAYYEDNIVPRKAQLDLAYAHRASLLSDLEILWRTLFALGQ